MIDFDMKIRIKNGNPQNKLNKHSEITTYEAAKHILKLIWKHKVIEVVLAVVGWLILKGSG